MAKRKLTTILTVTSNTPIEPIQPVVPTIPLVVSKATVIRELLASGMKPKDIAEQLGCKPQYVYGVIAYERSKAAKLKAKAKYARKKEVANGAPKRKYVKSGKYAKTVPAPTTPVVELDRDQLKAEQAELNELNADFIRQLQEANKPRIQYIEVEVPQPFSHYTFWQRLRILFLGRAA
jgi:transposase-like protein